MMLPSHFQPGDTAQLSVKITGVVFEKGKVRYQIETLDGQYGINMLDSMCFVDGTEEG